MTFNHTFEYFILQNKYGIRRESLFMAKQANTSRLSRLFNVAGFIVDGYNGIRYNAKNKQLVYLSLGLSALGTIIDFYISIKSASKLRKLSALGSYAINGVRLFTSFKKVRDEYDYH